jgi:hypothetical protein
LTVLHEKESVSQDEIVNWLRGGPIVPEGEKARQQPADRGIGERVDVSI